MQVEKISNTLYKFTLSLNNFSVNLVASIGADGILLVDTGWAQTAEDVKKAIRELHDGFVKLIVFTHQHGDHIGGRSLLGENATLVAHRNTRDELAGKYYALDPIPGGELPTIFLEDELSLRFNGEDIRINYAPGHTNSDMSVHFIDSGVVFLGDLIFSDTFTYLDLGRGGNIETYIQSLGRLLEQFPEGVKLVTGHGRDYTLEDLKEHYRMLVITTELIKGGIADEKDAQDMVAEDMLSEWSGWNSPQVSSENWINLVYQSLSGLGISIADPLTHTIVEAGIQAAIEQYHELKENQPDAYNFADTELNMLGYQLLWREMNQAAIAVLELNTQAYPDIANTYDSLGESYMTNGDKELAIDNFEKALSLDPDMDSAKNALKELRSTGEEA